MSKADLSLSHDSKMLIGNGLDVMADKYPRLFMGMIHHRTTKGKHLTFRDKPWLTAIYKDNSVDMVIIKCSQVHMTEHALCAMYTFANQGMRGMYVLPSSEHRKTFVADRINQMKDYSILYDNAIKNRITETDSNVYKSIFNRGWKFIGSNVKKDFFEFPCEVLFFDEYDQLNQDNLWYAYDRVSNAKQPIIWKFGNPTRDNHGIHAEFLESDQKEWHVDCQHCGHEQILDWYDNFITPYHNTWRLRHPMGRPVCTKCGKDFDRLGPGRWVSLNPGVGRASGYRISRLFVDKHKKPNDVIDLFKQFIKAQHNPTALQNFHNNYLGIPYENVDFKITKEALTRSVLKDTDQVEFDPAMFRTVMGVDQGKFFTCVISMVWDGELIDIHYANVKRWSDVEKLEKDFNVVSTVVDAQGGGYAETRDFVHANGNRWMCYYRPRDQIKGVKEYKLNHKDHVVDTNRTECLDLTVKMILEKKAHVRADFAHVDNKEFVKQMMESARITDNGGRPVWTKGKDHYFHATGYRYLAYRISGMKHSVASGSNWHSDNSTIKKRPEPKAQIIGEIFDKPDKKKRNRWHV